MSEAEMHAIEKAALEDPFIADALEGYSYTTTPAKDITELKEKLSAKEKNNRRGILFLQPKQKVWLRIAAIFILVIGVGSIFYFQNFQKGNKLLSKNEKFKSGTNDSSIAKNETVYDSAKSIAKTNASFDSSEQIVTNNNAYVQKPEFKILKNDSDKQLRDVSLLKNIPKKDMGYSTSTLSRDDMKQTEKADSIIFRMPADSTANVASSAEYKSKRPLNKSTQPVVFENDKKALDEVIVTAQGVTRKEKQTGFYEKKLEGKVPGLAVKSDSAFQPVGGWQKFNEYITNNVNTPVDEKDQKYKGNVVLSFEVNKKGVPKKIKVEQSLCTACDEEAIRLLKHGPKWNTTNKRNNVVIKF